MTFLKILRLCCFLPLFAAPLVFGSIPEIETHGPVIARPVIVSGLSQPLFLAAPPNDDERLFIVQKGGSVRVYDRGSRTLLPNPFLTVSPIASAGERGLLGLAFHPDYELNGFLYVHFTNLSGHSVIRRYQADPDNPNAVLAGSGLDLMTVSQPYTNHNAGWLGFGPLDGYLHIAMGDGGSGNDPLNHGQNKNTLLGSMLRIDVNGDDFPEDATRNYAIPADNPFVGAEGRDEIWAYGLRNPWRNSFDRETGDFWIADVGQGAREEVNFQPAGSPGGQNYGWRLREGTIATPSGGVGGNRPPGNVDPIYEYDFSDGRKSITGGYVYRGRTMPQLRGHYFFADYVADFIKSFRYAGTGMVAESDVVDWTTPFGQIPNPVSFGEDAEGELYIVSLLGLVYQITQRPWFLWRNRHFSAEEIADLAISGEAAAPDGDGIPNLLKHALGLSPGTPAPRPPMEMGLLWEEGEPFFELILERDPAADDVLLEVETTVDLTMPAWGTDGIEVREDSPDRLRVRHPALDGDGPQRFFRVRASRLE